MVNGKESCQLSVVSCQQEENRPRGYNHESKTPYLKTEN